MSDPLRALPAPVVPGRPSGRPFAGRPAEEGPLRRYWRLSRTPTYGVIGVVPLLVLYDVLIAAVNRGRSVGLRNGAEVLLGRALAAFGAHATLTLTAVLAVLGALFVVREQRRHRLPLDRRVFAGMFAESACLALAIGPVIAAVTSILVSPILAIQAVNGPPLALTLQATTGPLTRIALSLGAGVYEELVFRVLLVTAVAWAARASGRMGPRGALALAVVVSAVVFSAAHYRPFNPAGEALQVVSFIYRFVAGLAFSAIFALRGFGVAAWTHALYDVWLVIG